MNFSLFLFTGLLAILLSTSDEISQWRGPQRDGIYPATNLLKEWPAEGPVLQLKIEDVGKGFSQPIVYDDKIFITGIKSDTLDVLSVYTKKGTLLWEKVYGVAWNKSYPDSRSTPTIENNRVYLVSGLGDLVCLDAENGNVLWKQNPVDDFQGVYGYFGIAESVLLTDKAALFTTAGDETTVVAYDKTNGELLWKTKSMGGKRSYTSSLLVEWGGKKIALVQTSDDLIAVETEKGEILWSFNTIDYHTRSSRGKGESANTPLFYKGDIFTTYGNEQPGLLLSMSDDASSVELKWRNDTLDTHHGGLVLYDGTIYASDMINNAKGNWTSVDWETGETNWEKEWFTKGSIIAADGRLYLYEEKSGHVALVQPDTTEMKIISTFQVTEGEGPHWAHPAIYDGLLYIRHGNVLLVYNIQG
jgi:outer membrane protein assembly factor BamB